MDVVAFYKALAKVLEEKTGVKIEVKEIEEHGKKQENGRIDGRNVWLPC